MAQEEPTPAPASTPANGQMVGHWIGAVVCIVLLVVVDWFLVVPMGVGVAMVSDSCGERSTAFICTATGQSVTAAVPFLGALVGLVLAVIGAVRHRHRLPCWVFAWTAAPAGLMASLLIASAAHA